MVTSIRELWEFRELLQSLTCRDLRVRYKQSLLGVGWAVLLPFSLMLVFTFVFTRAFDGSAVAGLRAPYPLYLYVGLVPWTFFSVALGNCVNSLVVNRSLVTKVYFPREVFPLSCVAAGLVDLLIASTVVAALGLYYQLRGDWDFRPNSSMLLIPLLVAIQTFLTIGLGFVLAMANLYYRDVRQIFAAGIQLAMFVSAVVVPIPANGSWLSGALALNPMVPLMDGYRACVLYGSRPAVGSLVYAAAISIACLIGGWICFRRASFRFAECI